MSYVVLACAVILSAVMIDIFITKQRYISTRQCWLTVLALVAMTLVFNNVIVGFDIVQYREAVLLGAYVPFMPVEDLSYAISAGILIPSLMKHYEA